MQRLLTPELMDDPNLDPLLHAQALRGLARLNLLAGSDRIPWKPLRRWIGQRRGSFDVLDIATGSGDVPLGLGIRARRAGIDLALHGCDLSGVALDQARQRARSLGLDFTGFQQDAIQDPFQRQYDVVLCKSLSPPSRGRRGDSSASACGLSLFGSASGLRSSSRPTGLVVGGSLLEAGDPILGGARRCAQVGSCRVHARRAGFDGGSCRTQVSLDSSMLPPENASSMESGRCLSSSPSDLMRWSSGPVRQAPSPQPFWPDPVAARSWVERAKFPRTKVCGGCLAPAGIAALRNAGLGEALDSIDPLPLDALHLHARRAPPPLIRSSSTSRSSVDGWDQAFVEAATDSGATFISECRGARSVPMIRCPSNTPDVRSAIDQIWWWSPTGSREVPWRSAKTSAGTSIRQVRWGWVRFSGSTTRHHLGWDHHALWRSMATWAVPDCQDGRVGWWLRP